MSCPGYFRKNHEGSDYETCSYCGSLKFEDVLGAVEDGYSVIPTDKKHKLYVRMPNKEPLRLKVIAVDNSPEPPDPTWEPVDFAALEHDGWSGEGPHRWMLRRPYGPTTEMPFYMDHMPEDGLELFIDLYKGGVVNVAWPGYFPAWGI